MRHLLVAAILALLPAAALAERQVGLSLAPRSLAEANALRAGLALWALDRHLDGGGTTRSFAREVLPALAGGANWAAVDQRGRDHGAELRQSGPGNAQLVIQRGRGTLAEVHQKGGETGVLFLWGW